MHINLQKKCSFSLKNVHSLKKMLLYWLLNVLKWFFVVKRFIFIFFTFFRQSSVRRAQKKKTYCT